MNSTEATYATQLSEWLPSQPELHEPCSNVKALGWGRGWTVCFCGIVAAS